MFNQVSNLGAMKMRRSVRMPVRLGKPLAFDQFRDPKGRFILSHPKGWVLHREGEAVHAESETMGSFVGVDPFALNEDPWEIVIRQASEMGGKLDMAWKRASRVEHRRGDLTLGRMKFQWDGYLWKGRKSSVLLSLGNVIDSRRGRSLESYEDKTLAAIRRAFRSLV